MNVVKKWLKLIDTKTLWAVLTGFVPGVLLGVILLLLGLVLLAPEPNVPPPHVDNSPGDVTIQLSQEFLTSIASEHLSGFGIPTPFGTLPLKNVRAQPQSGDQLSVTGDVEFPITGSRQVLAVMRPCVASDGRPKFIVNRVLLGDQPITDLVGQSIQDQVNDATKNFNPNLPHQHLSRILTTSNAMILIYSSSGTGGQPAC